MARAGVWASHHLARGPPQKVVQLPPEIHTQAPFLQDTAGRMGIHKPCPGSLAEFASSLIWMHNERLMWTGLTLGQSPVVDTNVVLGIIFNIRFDHYP